MATTPNPSHMADYQTRLAALVATRDAHAEASDDHQVKNLNRRIQAQLRWIARAGGGASG